MTVSAPDTASPRDRLLVAAERLIAERGMHVPLRDVALAAGQRNNSAIHYHFGDRDALIEALIAYRMEQLEDARLEALAIIETEPPPAPVEALVRVLVEPMFDLARQQGASHYARCLEVLRSHPAIRAQGEPGGRASVAIRLVTARLLRHLDGVPPSLRAARLRAMTTAMFGLLADHEASFADNALCTEDEVAAREDVVRMLVALVTVPAPD